MIIKDSFRKSASVEISGADEQNCFGHLQAYFEIVWNAMRGESGSVVLGSFSIASLLGAGGRAAVAPANGRQLALLADF
jgi:hypothetical protein